MDNTLAVLAANIEKYFKSKTPQLNYVGPRPQIVAYLRKVSADSPISQPVERALTHQLERYFKAKAGEVELLDVATDEAAVLKQRHDILYNVCNVQHTINLHQPAEATCPHSPLRQACIGS